MSAQDREQSQAGAGVSCCGTVKNPPAPRRRDVLKSHPLPLAEMQPQSLTTVSESAKFLLFPLLFLSVNVERTCARLWRDARVPLFLTLCQTVSFLRTHVQQLFLRARDEAVSGPGGKPRLQEPERWLAGCTAYQPGDPNSHLTPSSKAPVPSSRSWSEQGAAVPKRVSHGLCWGNLFTCPPLPFFSSL